MEQDIFEKLKHLQDVLYKKFKVENEIADIPKALSTKKQMVNRLKKGYIDKNRYIERKVLRLKTMNERLSEIEAKRIAFEEQMDVIETQREYEILDKQIKEANEQEQKIRKDIKKEDFELNELKENLSKNEELIKQQEADLEIEKSKIDNQMIEKNKDLAILNVEQDKITPGMENEILFKFNRIIRNKEGQGIVPINDKICTGCHMQLPAQFSNDIRQGTEIKFCPYCSRILFYEEIEEIQEDFAFSEADSGSLADLVDLSEFEDI